MPQKRLIIRLGGRVQGVGCRPFIHTLATTLGLKGFVFNDTNGVTIEIQGKTSKIDTFILELQEGTSRPAMLQIDSCSTQEIPPNPLESEFVIDSSKHDGEPVCQVCPDIATCSDCLGEMNSPVNFRYRYPFINCTQCGPRYSILKTIPYDRPNTTMSGFAMCSQCRSQYTNVSDRRFHAQPVACSTCGPQLSLLNNQGSIVEKQNDQCVAKSAQLLKAGKILAIKGIGGFHLAVDATNEQAVRLLRQRKHREAKPFAMMAGRVEMIEQYAQLDPTARELLTSPAAPIVLLPKKLSNRVAPGVAEGTSEFGFMLPYAPLHHLLFAEVGIDVLVMTSANLSDEPLICDNIEALSQLNQVADYFLVHNRPVYRQVDDSVAHIIDGKPALLRRSRGYVPEPILQKNTAEKNILAVGADLKNTFCFVKGNQFLLSEHIGDLEKSTVYRHYLQSIDHLAGLFEIRPEVIVHDLHPGYVSTQAALDLAAKTGVPAFGIQHHWAHAAAVMAEYQLQDTVIALVADGTGYGTDDAIWGCECLVCSLTQFQRFGHLEYYPLAGGDRASLEAIRPLLGLCKTSGITLPQNILNRIEPDEQKRQLLHQQIEKGIAAIPTSSLGRLFDAVAALIGVGVRNQFEAQLPIALESIADPNTDQYYPFQLHRGLNNVLQWSPESLLKGILEDINKAIDVSIISARFHRTVCQVFCEFASLTRRQTGLSRVVLSGGVFCNRYLANQTIDILQKDGFEVFCNRRVPANDGGIALGQAAIQNALLKQP